MFSELPSASAFLYVVDLPRLQEGKEENRLCEPDLLRDFGAVHYCVSELQTVQKKGCWCSYSESLGQSALRQRSTVREQPTALLPDLSERPEEPTLSEREHWNWYYRLLVYAFASTQ